MATVACMMLIPTVFHYRNDTNHNAIRQMNVVNIILILYLEGKYITYYFADQQDFSDNLQCLYRKFENPSGNAIK